ncbi:unnamed protein product [Trichobilharzia szidati]|nr:unnamed protein product [Trichobilharzia szidati]
MNEKLVVYDSESAPGGPSGRQQQQQQSKPTGQVFDMDYSQEKQHYPPHPHQQQQQSGLSGRPNCLLQQYSYNQPRNYDNSYTATNNNKYFQFFTRQSDLKYNYSDSDEPSSFYQPMPLNNYPSHRHTNHRIRKSERLPKHKYFEHMLHQKISNSHLSMLSYPYNQSSTPPTVALFKSGSISTSRDNVGVEDDGDELSLSVHAPPPPPPAVPRHHVAILPSPETAFKPINHQSIERITSSSSQSIHELTGFSGGGIGDSGVTVMSGSSRNKMNSTPNLLDFSSSSSYNTNTINTTANSAHYNNNSNNSNVLFHKHQQLQMQLQQLKQLQRQDNQQATRMPTFKTNCTTKSMEELLRRQKKLDHLQYCLQRYEIEREEAGQAIRRIEERMQELEARATDLLEFDISKNLNNDNSINCVQQWRNSSSTVYNQADRLSSNDLENQYISWLKSIENATNNNNLKTSFSIENDGGNADNYAQNNYMYIESSLNETPPSSNQQPRQRCSLEHTFNNNVTKPMHNSSPESKRNLLLEHLLIQRQRLATADASVASLAKRLLLLNSNAKSQQDSTLDKKFQQRKLSAYSSNPNEQSTPAFDELTDSSSLYNNQQIMTSSTISNVLRNSKLMMNSCYTNPTVQNDVTSGPVGGGVSGSEAGAGSTSGLFQYRYPHSWEDDILPRRNSPNNKQAILQKSSTIERTSSSSIKYLLDSPQLNSSLKSTNTQRKFAELSPANYTSTNNTNNNNNNSNSVNTELSGLQQNDLSAVVSAERRRLPTPIRTDLATWCIGSYSNKIPQLSKLTGLQRASENGYIELANASSSSPVPEEDYTSRLLRGTSKTQLPSRRYFNINATLNNSMTGLLTPVNCPLSSTLPLSYSDKMLPRQSSSLSQTPAPLMKQQSQPAPPLPPKPISGKPQTFVDSQEHLSAEDEEVYKFMSRSFDNNEELDADFQPLNRNFTDSKQRPLPPPYYVNINDDNNNNEKLLNQRKFPHKITRTLNNSSNKTVQQIKETAKSIHEQLGFGTIAQQSSSSTTSLNDLHKEDKMNNNNNNSRINMIKCKKVFNSTEMKNSSDINQIQKVKRYVKQKPEYAFNLRDYLQSLHHPVDNLSLKSSDTSALPEANTGMCLSSILGSWITSRTSKAQKLLLAEDESLDYFQCKIILTGRICGGYLWIMKKPSRNRNNIWDSIKRRVAAHDSTANHSTTSDNDKRNKRIVVRSSSQARWSRKWLSCDMLEQKIFICERKGNGRIDCTINFSIIKDVHQSSTEQLLDCQKSFSSNKNTQRSSYSLSGNNPNNNTEIKSNLNQDNSRIILDSKDNQQHQQQQQQQLSSTPTTMKCINNTETTSTATTINCTEKTETFFCLETTLHTFFLMAPSSELTRLWMDVLKQAMKMASSSSME